MVRKIWLSILSMIRNENMVMSNVRWISMYNDGTLFARARTKFDFLPIRKLYIIMFLKLLIVNGI